jgi:hypothetical protein
VGSIFTVFKENAPKSTKGSLGGDGKDKKPSIAEEFSTKFLGMETVLLTDLKCDALTGITN